jgi:hypothetical protein
VAANILIDCNQYQFERRINHRKIRITGAKLVRFHAKELGIPSVYYTNMLSVRPLFLAGGMIASLNFVRDLIERKPLYERMVEFFDDAHQPPVAQP